MTGTRPTADHHRPGRLAALVEASTRPGWLRVPQITVLFWVIKSLSTAMGEATSDYLVHILGPVPAVLLGFFCFVVALTLQLVVRRYIAWTYWFAVVMVGVFGTMGADVLHVGLGVPYPVSAALCAVVLAGVFASWASTEHTLSIHTINTTRRELFYWAAVVATFALGTALGDLTAVTVGIGYLGSVALFAAIMVIPIIGYRVLHWNPVLCFWFAYVLTRPLGASVADWMGKPIPDGGLGWGSGPVALALTVAIVALVAYLAITKRDLQPRAEPPPVGATER